jgi:ABC-2 type transport system ATP-binding protein
MQQRLGIAQALLNEPELVILDEPSLGLDPVGMVEVRELIKNIRREGMTVFISSHLLFEIEQICTHVTIIHHGVSLASDTLQNISQKLSGPNTIVVEVANLSEAIIESLRRLPIVSSVMQDDGTLTIELKTRDDVRGQISQEITRLGGVILSMVSKSQTLENVFMKLVAKS